MFFMDPTFLLLIPPLILAAYASAKVRSTFAKYSRRRAGSGISGADAARRFLHANGLTDVRVEPVPGELSDHYDPRKRVLRLSRPVYGSNSLAALGVAAHEAGHAVQDARGYLPLKLRSGIYPLAAFGNNLGPVLFFIGMMLMFLTGGGGQLALPVAKAGIILFAGGTVFTLITLPVEFNASRRALVMLQEQGIVTASERADAKRVLNAAALTYVAAAFVAIMMLLRFILLFAGMSRRR